MWTGQPTSAWKVCCLLLARQQVLARLPGSARSTCLGTGRQCPSKRGECEAAALPGPAKGEGAARLLGRVAALRAGGALPPRLLALAVDGRGRAGARERGLGGAARERCLRHHAARVLRRGRGRLRRRRRGAHCGGQQAGRRLRDMLRRRVVLACARRLPQRGRRQRRQLMLACAHHRAGALPPPAPASNCSQNPIAKNAGSACLCSRSICSAA